MGRVNSCHTGHNPNPTLYGEGEFMSYRPYPTYGGGGVNSCHTGHNPNPTYGEGEFMSYRPYPTYGEGEFMS